MADINLNITVPEAHAATTLEALEALAGLDLKVASKTLEAVHLFNFKEKQQGESNKDFVERATIEIVKALVKLKFLGDDRAKYKDDVSNIVLDETAVPNDILT